MNTLQSIVFRGSKRPTKGARPARTLTSVELASVDPKPNHERLADYWHKRRHHSQAHEFERFFAILNCINDCFAAEAEAAIDWAARLLIVTVDQGGKTVYSATAEMDSPAIEAKVRLIRHELEQLKVAALAGLKGVA